MGRNAILFLQIIKKGRFIMTKQKHSKTKFLSAVSAAVLMFSFCTAVFADTLQNPVKTLLYQNGEQLELENFPLQKDNMLYLPIREFLSKTSPQTELIWNEDKTILLKGQYTEIAGEKLDFTAKFGIDSPLCEITKSGKTTTHTLTEKPFLNDSKTYIPYNLMVLLDNQISLTAGFEAVAPADDTSAQKLRAALTWANALKTRDGKPRYDIMTEEMQQKFIEEQKALVSDDDNWYYVIGWSSPWVISYDISISGAQAYITYHQADSTKERYSAAEKITFSENDGKILVSASEISYSY